MFIIISAPLLFVFKLCKDINFFLFVKSIMLCKFKLGRTATVLLMDLNLNTSLSWDMQEFKHWRPNHLSSRSCPSCRLLISSKSQGLPYHLLHNHFIELWYNKKCLYLTFPFVLLTFQNWACMPNHYNFHLTFYFSCFTSKLKSSLFRGREQHLGEDGKKKSRSKLGSSSI